MSTAEAQTAHLTFDYPQYFLVEDSAQAAGADLVLVHTTDAGFRPNLVVTSVESDAALSDASLTAMRAALAQHAGAHVVAADGWLSALDDGREVLGRRLIFTYPAETAAEAGAQIVVSKWVWATGTHHVHLSASASMSQWQAFSAVFDAIAARTRLAATDETLGRLAEPALPLDRQAVSRGEQLEDLRPVAAEWQQLSLDRASRASSSVTTTRDALGSDAYFNTLPLFNISARRGLRTEQLVVYAHEHGSTLVATAPLHEEPLAAPDLVTVTNASAERTPAAIAEWMALRPAWAFASDTTALSPAQIENHVSAPEPGGSGSVAPWTQFILMHENGSILIDLTPDNGYVQLVSSDNTSYTPHPLPSANLFGELVRICALRFEGR